MTTQVRRDSKAPAPAAVLQPSSTFDERWAAWEARGAAHDRAFHRRLTIAVPAVIVLIAIIFYVLAGR